ncbi:YciI family protein [Burkholderia multivorans]|nr:YciI family protein [Burkholderia multivorans]
MSSQQQLYLAVFLGSKDSPRMKAWIAQPEQARREKEQEGIAAWRAWADRHRDAIVEMGGPLGKTKTVSARGIDDTSNALGGFTIVRAASHDAAARMFEGHPHFTIFPGETIDVMPVLEIPRG